MDDAKCAVTVAADHVELDDADAIDHVRSMAAALLFVASELAEIGPEGVARRSSAIPTNAIERQRD